MIFPRVFSNDPAMLGRRIQQQNQARPPVAVAPIVPTPPPPPRMVAPSYRPVVVPSPDELGIRLDTTTSSLPGLFEVPPPDRLGITLD